MNIHAAPQGSPCLTVTTLQTITSMFIPSVGGHQYICHHLIHNYLFSSVLCKYFLELFEVVKFLPITLFLLQFGTSGRLILPDIYMYIGCILISTLRLSSQNFRIILDVGLFLKQLLELTSLKPKG